EEQLAQTNALLPVAELARRDGRFGGREAPLGGAAGREPQRGRGEVVGVLVVAAPLARLRLDQAELRRFGALGARAQAVGRPLDGGVEVVAAQGLEGRPSVVG